MQAIRTLWSRRSSRLLVAGAAVALVAAGAAVGATLVTNVFVDSSGAYHGCVNNGSGGLRVVMPGEACRSNEVAIDWNQAGQPGLKGDKGDRGATGPPGAKGATGANGRDASLIVGEINENGTIARGTGFTATKTTAFGYDLYSLTFPGSSPGCGEAPFPVLSVVPEPLFVNAPAITWRIAGESTNCGTGAQTVTVGFVDPTGASATSRFGFIATR